LRSLEEKNSIFFVPIDQTEINTKCRDYLPAILFGLQHMYSDKALLQQVLMLMRDHVAPDIEQDTGRPEMHWWRILILAIVKQGFDCDYARLMELANQLKALPLMLLHEFHDGHRYTERTPNPVDSTIPV